MWQLDARHRQFSEGSFVTTAIIKRGDQACIQNFSQGYPKRSGDSLEKNKTVDLAVVLKVKIL